MKAQPTSFKLGYFIASLQLVISGLQLLVALFAIIIALVHHKVPTPDTFMPFLFGSLIMGLLGYGLLKKRRWALIWIYISFAAMATGAILTTIAFLFAAIAEWLHPQFLGVAIGSAFASLIPILLIRYFQRRDHLFPRKSSPFKSPV